MEEFALCVKAVVIAFAKINSYANTDSCSGDQRRGIPRSASGCYAVIYPLPRTVVETDERRVRLLDCGLQRRTGLPRAALHRLGIMLEFEINRPLPPGTSAAST